MPVSVPKEPKVLTTIYDNFKGVDFTDDASNVFRRRSPDGKNMLPDIDGKPYKRTGWEIELTPHDFCVAAGLQSDVDVIPDKTYYFELGGYDCLMIFNNLGIFSYRTNPLVSQQNVFPRLLVHMDQYVDLEGATQAFPPEVDGETIPVDARRAFFFEGKGKAGFYLFVGLRLFRYDGAYFIEEKPYVPLVQYLCAPNGAGEPLESVNMLTRERIVQYACDGTSKEFTVPGGIMQDDNNQYMATVETRKQNGDWETASGYTIAQGKISFTTAPSVVVQGEDNLRVTYTPDGQGATVEEKDVELTEKEIWVMRGRMQRETCTDWADYSGWQTYYTWYEFGGAAFDTPNVKINSTTFDKDAQFQVWNGSEWVDIPASTFTPKWGAYNDNVELKPKDSMYSSVTPNRTTENVPAWSQTAWEWYNSYFTEHTRKVKKKKNGKTKTVTEKYYVGHNQYHHYRQVYDYKYYRVRVKYKSYVYTSGENVEDKSTTAFTQCTRALVFGSGIINQVFLSSTPYPAYNTRVWYSAATDPTYFPDTNYIEVGATDTPIMGMMKVGEYLGIIKQGTSFDTSIYLAYPTSFDDDTTYAVKQNVNGIGAISNGAFNTLNEEPMFLSKEGVMGIEVSTQDTDRKLRNRSFYINKKLRDENNLSQAVSFVYRGMYYLAVNNHCYVLDGSQKNSWANTKTNLQYECYYLDNVPAQCFCRFNDELWFTDFKGNLCRFKEQNDNKPYRDAYSLGEPDVKKEPDWLCVALPINNRVFRSNISAIAASGDPKAGDTARLNWKINNMEVWYTITSVDSTYVYLSQHDQTAATDKVRKDYLRGKTPEVNDTLVVGDVWYTITSIDDTYAYLTQGVPIDAVWSTIADDDGAVHFFKTLKKKGTMVSLMPSSDSGVKVYLRADGKDKVFVGETDAKDYELPFDFYAKKKMKKYKRLQFICENNTIDDSFGVDQITKCYTVGNYSKNKR